MSGADISDADITIADASGADVPSTDVPGVDVLGRAAAVADWLHPRAALSPASATLPADTVDLLESEGMFRLGLPRGLGGREADPLTLVRTAETLAYADGSAAWATMTGNSSMFFAWLDQTVAKDLLGDRPGRPVASSFAPTGRGVEEAGGYRLSGRWSFVSGSPHASLLVVGFMVAGPDGAPRFAGDRPLMRWAVLPATDVRIVPTWNDAAGLRASGSHDVVAEDVHVPDERTLLPLAEAPTADGALYRMPFYTGVRSLLVGIPLGVARRALDEVTQLIRVKTRETQPLVRDQDTQIRLAEAEAALRAARHYLLETTEHTWETVRSGAPVALPLRAEYTLAAQFAMRSAVDAVNLAFGVAGASASLAGDVIQRCWRDANVASQHIAFSRGRWRAAGQALLGADLDPDTV
ncbi:acyl-CoA dehydrogenase family protein [Streptomyces sp. NPDC091281]|uniref:acyl-CoA dehydrogenase family protein n=1 Tax=Streptomyces sp. NPDC091281 TaxID=3365985 RepID=UPI003826EC4D